MNERKEIPFPGILTTADGTETVVWVETHIGQGACAYPITSSTNMGVGFEATVANGMKNLWGETLVFLESESEHSSASACEGFASAGGRITNFTSGQGLILMKEVLYVISGKRLPAVFNIAARALTSHSLNVHAGHDDVMGVADVGWGMLFAKNAQEIGDLALICRRTAEVSHTPFMNIQDGFLTSHTVESVLLPEPELMKDFVGYPKVAALLDVENPIMIGPVQNQDSYMKGKIAQRYFYDMVAPRLKEAMEEYFRLTGRRYDFVEPYKLEDAELAIVGMGSMMETATATVDYLRDNEGIQAGLLNITSFRPFPGPQVVEALKDMKAISIIERMDAPLGQSNPLTTEIKAAFADAMSGAPGYPHIDRVPAIYSGCGGLGSRDIRPGDFIAIAENMMGGNGRRFFVVGIDHPLALKRRIDPDIRPKGAYSMRGHSVGGFGSITTNKVIATMVADLFGLQVQAYPKYGSEKKGLPTSYYLTIAPDKIWTHCELKEVDFVPLNDINAFNLANPLAGVQVGGMVFIQTDKETPEEVWCEVPNYAKKLIKEKNIQVLCLDTIKIAREVATHPDLIQRMQGIVLLGIFLRHTPFRTEFKLSEEELFAGVEKSLRKYFGKRGEQVVQDNLNAVKKGFNDVFEIPRTVVDR